MGIFLPGSHFLVMLLSFPLLFIFVECADSAIIAQYFPYGPVLNSMMACLNYTEHFMAPLEGPPLYDWPIGGHYREVLLYKYDVLSWKTLTRRGIDKFWLPEAIVACSYKPHCTLMTLHTGQHCLLFYSLIPLLFPRQMPFWLWLSNVSTCATVHRCILIVLMLFNRLRFCSHFLVMMWIILLVDASAYALYAMHLQLLFSKSCLLFSNYAWCWGTLIIHKILCWHISSKPSGGHYREVLL